MSLVSVPAAKHVADMTQWRDVRPGREGHNPRIRLAFWNQCSRYVMQPLQSQIAFQTRTCDGRSLLSHQTSSSRPHRDRKEGSREDRARGQRELSGPLYGSPGGYPMDHDHPGDGIARGTQEAWLCQALWPEQDGTDPTIASDTTRL